ncbi:hypothetical protein HD806DRAFT_478970 [Xylariaceae sp. AK1471]|nr:hypothetical protein HD806DRAFT_478970 [Xylariaceae sp. AK1471]
MHLSIFNAWAFLHTVRTILTAFTFKLPRNRIHVTGVEPRMSLKHCTNMQRNQQASAFSTIYLVYHDISAA